MSLVLKRKSIRKFIPAEIQDETIERLMMSAMQAPSATNQQPWAFIVIKNQAILEKLSNISKGAWPLKDAPLGILTLMKKDVNRPLMAPQDLAAATQNILLEATHMGLGSVWIGVYPKEDRIGAIEDILTIDKDTIPFSLIALGYPDDSVSTHVKYRFDKSNYKVIE